MAGERHAEGMREIMDAVLSAPAGLGPEVRRAIFDGDPPESLRTYVQKVRLQAYTVVDSDVEELRAKGYTEDAIFEATVAAATGAAMMQLERGLSVL